MAWKTPLVEHNHLRDLAHQLDIAVDSPAWFAWLADEQHVSFHFRDPAGEFTARKERKQRGQAYWVAYRQAQHKLRKRYLGKPEALTAEHLRAVAATLSAACATPDCHDEDASAVMPED